MVLANLRLARLGHDQAHQIVRPRVVGRQSYGVAGVALGFPNRSPTEKAGGESDRRPGIIGIQLDDPAQQGFRRRFAALPGALVMQQGKRRQRGRRAGGQVEEQAFGGRISRSQRRADPGDLCRLRRRPWPRPVQGAAAIGGKAAAAGARAGRSGQRRCGDDHAPIGPNKTAEGKPSASDRAQGKQGA